ncbi:hypothetical protein [Mucilaginibacter lappiensis]|uniref:hypothetical protein n=1 Tax=Mucilaginibacter lappiensis TaxID=354630 RepID=UPI003D1BE833
MEIGTMVAFFSKNAWAEYASIPQEDVIVLPRGGAFDKASQVAVSPITAWGLLERADVKAGDWLLLTAGNSIVSKLLIQF